MFLHSVLIGVLGKQLVDGVLRDLMEEKVMEMKDMFDEAEGRGRVEPAIFRTKAGDANHKTTES